MNAKKEPTAFEIKTTISNVDIPACVTEEQFYAVMGNIYAALAKLYGEDEDTAALDGTGAADDRRAP